ncbi:MAG: hypothetical protein LC772_05230 [Chloroflexi bacterium]|nr:hypothetical protein [Chloroflexota bacterium]
MGTTAEAIAAGMPQVMIPLAFDQFDNAARAARLGVGRTLPRHRLTAERLTGMIQAVLNSPEMANACAQLRSRVEPEAPLRRAVELIEAMTE